MKKRESQEICDKIVTALKEERIKKAITQYKLAKDTGLSKSSILYIETFKQRPSLTTAILIANYLEVDLAEIIKSSQQN